MKWSGDEKFINALKGAHDLIQTFAAREVFEVAKDVRDRTLENFTAYSIGMQTGRSRALVAAEPGPGLFERGQRFRLEAQAGYTKWPKHDHFSPTEEIPFYPHYLNYGTARMSARPYFSAAVDVVKSTFKQRMETAMDKAMAAYFRATA